MKHSNWRDVLHLRVVFVYTENIPETWTRRLKKIQMCLFKMWRAQWKWQKRIPQLRVYFTSTDICTKTDPKVGVRHICGRGCYSTQEFAACNSLVKPDGSLKHLVWHLVQWVQRVTINTRLQGLGFTRGQPHKPLNLSYYWSLFQLNTPTESIKKLLIPWQTQWRWASFICPSSWSSASFWPLWRGARPSISLQPAERGGRIRFSTSDHVLFCIYPDSRSWFRTSRQVYFLNDALLLMTQKQRWWDEGAPSVKSLLNSLTFLLRVFVKSRNHGIHVSLMLYLNNFSCSAITI